MVAIFLHPVLFRRIYVLIITFYPFAYQTVRVCGCCNNVPYLPRFQLNVISPIQYETFFNSILMLKMLNIVFKKQPNVRLEP